MFATLEDLENQVMVTLGGRAAEELVFGRNKITTGASNDLNKASRLVAGMALDYGMDDEMGLFTPSVLGGHGSENALLKNGEVTTICRKRLGYCAGPAPVRLVQLQRVPRRLRRRRYRAGPQ
jgi:ATP-dependent Zn protease